MSWTLWDRLGPRILLIAALVLFAIIGIGPLLTLLARSLENDDGRFIGLHHYVTYLTDPGLLHVIGNTLFVSLATSVITVGTALIYAYGIQRTRIPCKWLLRMIALSPLFAPSLMHGIALIYLFGNKGLITTGFFGHIPGFDVGIYGPLGIVIAECIANFPSAYLLLTIALSMSDRRLKESAEIMGASPWMRFISITLPSIKYGLISAFFVTFTACFVDFGAPKVIGGNFNVLSIEIYKQVVGLQNFNLGAAISLVLAIPSILAFWADRSSQRKAQMTFSSKSVPLEPTGGLLRIALFTSANTVIAAFIATINVVVLFASLLKSWPYNLEFTWIHYDFSYVAGGGWNAYWTSVRLGLATALIGTTIAFLCAWLVQRAALGRVGVGLLRALLLLPLSLPGMVIGLAYIFFFNAPHWGLGEWTIPNPVGSMYNTFWILVAANIFHFISVPYLTTSGALAKLDPEIEHVSATLGIPFWSTLARVTLPMSREAIAETALYLFVNSTITVSAVIFLFSPHTQLAAISVVDMEDAGDIASAAAMSILILLTNVIARLLYLAFIALNRLPRRIRP